MKIRYGSFNADLGTGTNISEDAARDIIASHYPEVSNAQALTYTEDGVQVLEFKKTSGKLG